MVNSPMDREESIDYATYLVLNEALTKGFVEMSLLGKFSRIPGFDKSAIGMMKGQIKDIAQSAIDSPIESKKQLELLKSQLDMKRIESLYLPADVKDYVEMIVHAKIYRAFKEGIETDKAFIWKRILIPILEQRSDEIYNKRQVILNGFLDAPISIYEKIYNKYVPLNPDKIEMLENKLETYGIPINFPHTPDDLMNVDIQTGIIEDTKDRVVVRFAPTPNGPLSIGHSRGVCLLGEYEKRYPGAKLLLRFDDTDPAKSTDLSEYGIPDVFQQIIDEMEWLLDTDIPKRNIIIASERFTLYQNEVINAIRNGKAVCDTRRDELVSGVDNNLSVFASMLKGEYAAGEAAVKLTASIPKGDLSKDYDNRAGEILFRMVEYDGENLCVPLMNLQSVVDDKKTGVTHIVRGADHDGGNLGRQKKIWSEMGYGQFPFVDNWGLVALTDDQEYNTYITSKEFDDKHDRIDTTLVEKAGKMGILTTRISTSRMRKGMNEGLYSENQFQSPELPTLTSLKHEHLYMENSKPITSEAIRAYWNIVRHNQDVTAIFNREELRQLNERMSKGGYVFEEKAYADEQERRDYIKGLKMQDRYYAEEDEENKPSKISGLMLANTHWIPMYKKTKKEGESFDAWYERFMFRKSAESFDAESEKLGIIVKLDRDDKMAKVLAVLPNYAEGKKAMTHIFKEGLKERAEDYDETLMSITEGKKKFEWYETKSKKMKYLDFYHPTGYDDVVIFLSEHGMITLAEIEERVNFDTESESFGGDPEGPLAKALEKARKNAKKPKKPLKIERLDSEFFNAENEVYEVILGSPVVPNIDIKTKTWDGKPPRAYLNSTKTQHRGSTNIECPCCGRQLYTHDFEGDLSCHKYGHPYYGVFEVVDNQEGQNAESFEAEGRCPITGEPVARGKTYADGEVAKMANQTIKLFGGKRGGFRRSDVMKAVMALNDYGGELSATGWAERVNSNPKYRTSRELNPSNVHRVLAFLKPDVYERKYTGYSMKAKYVYSIVKGDKLIDWLKPEFIPEEFKKK